MVTSKYVQIFLEDGLRRSAEAGEHNFLRLVGEVLQDAGLTPVFAPIEDRDDARGFALTHMKAPISPQGLVFRRVYHYPFWQIERSDKRWKWDVALAPFDPSSVPEPEAARFQKFWRKRLFPDVSAQTGDAIYMPLQGKLTRHRSFQSCSPLDMVAAVLKATDRPVIVTLHPKEDYARQEVMMLDDILRPYPNALRKIGGMETYLPTCHMVVTQNSSAAFNGYFFDKPALLFGQIDFHHVARNVTPATVSDALASPPRQVDYAKYLWWFWQDRSINAGRSEAKEKIRARLARFDWPVT